MNIKARAMLVVQENGQLAEFTRTGARPLLNDFVIVGLDAVTLRPAKLEISPTGDVVVQLVSEDEVKRLRR